MSKLKLNKPTIDDLKNRINNFQKMDDLTYDKSYVYFLKYFENKNILTEEDLIISANFTYGWMPTILNFKSNKFNECVDILNVSKTKNRLEYEEIKTLKTLVNNSLVGTSKLLHFINPDKYAIWDSRVCKFLSNVTHKYFIEQIDIYFSYLDICKELTQKQDYDFIHQRYIQCVGHDATKMKSIEQLMFLSSEEPLKN
ncbi:MAG: hypothetical protein PHV10_02055 [Sulfuricurvum sp.]|nr:hypothetical protein [Sulfuricurvum sp.]